MLTVSTNILKYSLHPLRIQTYPDVILDIVLETLGGDHGPESKSTKDPSGVSSIMSFAILDSPQSSSVAESNDKSKSTSTTQEILNAANQGHANAQYSLGLMYEDGEGVPQDYSNAMEWYLKAGNQGDAKAQHKLGGMYGNGKGVSQDYSKAMEWYLKAAN